MKEFFLNLLNSSVIFATGAAMGVYWMRYKAERQKAENLQREKERIKEFKTIIQHRQRESLGFKTPSGPVGENGDISGMLREIEKKFLI